MAKRAKSTNFAKIAKVTRILIEKRKTNLAKVHTYKDQTPSRKNSQLKKIICEALNTYRKYSKNNKFNKILDL